MRYTSKTARERTFNPTRISSVLVLLNITFWALTPSNGVRSRTVAASAVEWVGRGVGGWVGRCYVLGAHAFEWSQISDCSSFGC